MISAGGLKKSYGYCGRNSSRFRSKRGKNRIRGCGSRKLPAVIVRPDRVSYIAMEISTSARHSIRFKHWCTSCTKLRRNCSTITCCNYMRPCSMGSLWGSHLECCITDCTSYLCDFNLEYASISPGTLVKAYSIEQAAYQVATHFDFLRGEEEYKYKKWRAQVRPTWRILYSLST